MGGIVQILTINDFWVVWLTDTFKNQMKRVVRTTFTHLGLD